MEKKFQVFISSTFNDLKEERIELMEALINLGHIPIGMELFNASDDTQWGVIKRRIDDSDYYILVLSDRYGSVDTDGIGFTEKEYDYAISIGIPVISFLRDKASIENLPFELRESSRRDALDNFKSKLSTRLYKHWSDKHELSKKFFLAFSELIREKPRAGWIKATELAVASNEKISELLVHNEFLLQKVSDLKQQVETSNKELVRFTDMDRQATRIVEMLPDKKFGFGDLVFNGNVLINHFSPFVSTETTVDLASRGIRQFLSAQTGEVPNADLMRYIVGAFASLGLIECKSETFTLHHEDNHSGDRRVRDEIEIVERITPTPLLSMVYSKTNNEDFKFLPKPQANQMEVLRERLNKLKDFTDWSQNEEANRQRKRGKIDTIISEFIVLAVWETEEERQAFFTQDFIDNSEALLRLLEKAEQVMRELEASNNSLHNGRAASDTPIKSNVVQMT
jgi:hypothetical protein